VTAEKGQLYATCPLQGGRPIPAWDKEDLGGSSNARAAKARFQKSMGTSKRDQPRLDRDSVHANSCDATAAEGDCVAAGRDGVTGEASEACGSYNQHWSD
jgi:hypothetical protein